MGADHCRAMNDHERFERPRFLSSSERGVVIARGRATTLVDLKIEMNAPPFDQTFPARKILSPLFGCWYCAQSKNLDYLQELLEDVRRLQSIPWRQNNNAFAKGKLKSYTFY
jgi:hypothetical protein